MTKGKVKWYDETRGYGFITTETGEDVFVHRTGINSSYVGLQNDQEVVFEVRKDDKGLVAINVEIAK